MTETDGERVDINQLCDNSGLTDMYGTDGERHKSVEQLSAHRTDSESEDTDQLCDNSGLTVMSEIDGERVDNSSVNVLSGTDS